MLKKTLISISIFILGVVFSWFIYEHLIAFIQYVYIHFSEYTLKFTGKNFHLFATPYYYIGFGVLFLYQYFLLQKKSIEKIIVNIIFSIINFFTYLAIISGVNSILEHAYRTENKNDTFNLRYNEINYDSIIFWSIVLLSISITLIEYKKIIQLIKKFYK